MDLASRIRAARRHANLTQQALADGVGVTRGAVSNWESPYPKWPTSENILKIALITGVTFEWLATGKGKMHQDASRHAIETANAVEVRLLEAFRRFPAAAKFRILRVIEMSDPDIA